MWFCYICIYNKTIIITMKTKLLLAAVFCAVNFLSASAVSPGLNDAYSRESFTDKAGTVLSYRMLKPEKINPEEKYPLVVFLHGAGERGSDNESQLFHGGSVFSNPVNMTKYPAFVIFPQCPAGERWAEYNKQNSFNDNAETPDESKNEKAIICLIEKLVADYPIDTDRLYITGLSMGGMGTFDLVCRHPDLFAAAIPICGAVNPTRLPAAKNVRFRIFHGANDDSVPTIWSRKAYKALKDAGAEVEYIEFDGTPQASWNPAFNLTDFLPWLFSQKKK